MHELIDYVCHVVFSDNTVANKIVEAVDLPMIRIRPQFGAGESTWVNKDTIKQITPLRTVKSQEEWNQHVRLCAAALLNRGV